MWSLTPIDQGQYRYPDFHVPEPLQITQFGAERFDSAHPTTQKPHKWHVQHGRKLVAIVAALQYWTQKSDPALTHTGAACKFVLDLVKRHNYGGDFVQHELRLETVVTYLCLGQRDYDHGQERLRVLSTQAIRYPTVEAYSFRADIDLWIGQLQGSNEDSVSSGQWPRSYGSTCDSTRPAHRGWSRGDNSS